MTSGSRVLPRLSLYLAYVFLSLYLLLELRPVVGEDHADTEVDLASRAPATIRPSHNEDNDCVAETSGHDQKLKCYECATGNPSKCRDEQKAVFCSNTMGKTALCVIQRKEVDGEMQFTKMCAETIHHHETSGRHKWIQLNGVDTYVCDEMCCNKENFESGMRNEGVVAHPRIILFLLAAWFLR